MKQVGHIRVETEGFGINFADIMARKGLYQDAPPTPCVVGYESVGRTMDDSTINGESVPAGTRVVAFSRFGGILRMFWQMKEPCSPFQRTCRWEKHWL